MNELFKKRTRLTPSERMEHILEGALMASEEMGYHRLTLQGIANQINISHGLILHHFKSIKNLKERIVDYAIEHRHLPTIANAISSGDMYALEHVPTALKRKAFNSLKK